MGMSTHVVGFRPPDEEWQKMKDVFVSCQKAGVPVPDDVWAFFDHDPPNDKPGAEVSLGDAVQEWGAMARKGYEIDITRLPKDVKIIRVYNAW